MVSRNAPTKSKKFFPQLINRVIHRSFPQLWDAFPDFSTEASGFPQSFHQKAGFPQEIGGRAFFLLSFALRCAFLFLFFA
jgi:hypothetical protein